MTKRFTLTFDDKIIDNLTGITHDVHSGYDVATNFANLLNNLNDENRMLKKLLKKNDIDFVWHQDYQEPHKDELYIKDNNTEIRLKNRNLFINVFIPDINECFKINYVVTGRKLTRWWDK